LDPATSSLSPLSTIAFEEPAADGGPFEEIPPDQVVGEIVHQADHEDTERQIHELNADLGILSKLSRKKKGALSADERNALIRHAYQGSKKVKDSVMDPWIGDKIKELRRRIVELTTGSPVRKGGA
jgi:hypothetical protein